MLRGYISALIAGTMILAGCTTYRHAVLPGQEPHPTDDGKAHVVGPRADVRITLDSGESVKGEVLRCSNEEIVLGRPGNFGIEEEVYSASSISEIEVVTLTPGGGASIAAFVAFSALLFYGLLDARNGS